MIVCENLIFSLFTRDTSEQYKATVLKLTYSAIKNKNGITESALTRKLKLLYGFEKSDITTALACLTNKNIFGSVSRYEVKQSGAVHLRVRPSDKWESWQRKN